MFKLSVVLPGLALIALGASLACASPVPAGTERPARIAAPRADESGVYPTIEAAVEAAFDAAGRAAGPIGRDRLRLGTIRRVAGGFAWVAPAASSSPVGGTRPVQVRLRLGPEDVAVYGLHPRSGLADLDRINENVTRHERRLVDEQDPLHRPLFVLTPSRRVVRYPEAPESVEVVRREAAGAGRR